jgi:SnoaL-like domain
VEEQSFHPIAAEYSMYVTRHHALAAGGNAEAAAQEMRDRAEIIDALYRFGLGQDMKDKELFASSFAPDAELDFRPAAARWGSQPPLMSGRDSIVTTILGMFTGRVDTTHQVTNPRIVIDGDRARLTALVEAQHLLTADHGIHALLKNVYHADLVRDGSRWVMRRVRIDNAWYTGDPAAIFG